MPYFPFTFGLSVLVLPLPLPLLWTWSGNGYLRPNIHHPSGDWLVLTLDPSGTFPSCSVSSIGFCDRTLFALLLTDSVSMCCSPPTPLGSWLRPVWSHLPVLHPPTLSVLLAASVQPPASVYMKFVQRTSQVNRPNRHQNSYLQPPSYAFFCSYGFIVPSSILFP